MTRHDPHILWLESDDGLREELDKQATRAELGASICFCHTIVDLWVALYRFEAALIVQNVIHPPIPGVPTLSEGVAVAAWIRSGRIPEDAAAFLGVPRERATLPASFQGRRPPTLCFFTGRTEESLRREVEAAGLGDVHIFEKHAWDMGDAVFDFIRDRVRP